MVEEKEKSRIIINEYVFDFIYGMAINDAMNRVAGVRKDDKVKLGENNKIRESVKGYAESIINGEIIDYDIVEQIIEDNNCSKKVDCLNFGKIQKLINMTMKYLYIKYHDDPEVSKNFDKCYAPMDGIMLKFVFESYYMMWVSKVPD